MRIALVVTGGFDRSGRERVIPSLLWLVERLARRHEVVVYVLRYHDRPCRYSLVGATVQDLGRPEGFWNQYTALSSATRADGPFDVIHGYWALPAGLLGAAIGRRLGVPSVVTCDSGEFVSFPRIGYGLQSGRRTRLVVSAATRLATRVTVCSHYQARLARAHGVVADLIPLGVDTTVFTERRATPHGPPFRLLHVASLNPVKDQASLLHALERLIASGLDVALDIAGEDTTGGAVADLARSLGLRDRVTFHGFLPSELLVPMFHAADLFVLPSLHEAAGVVVLEAAACGVPVVGSDVGYLADWAPHGATVVEPGNPGALSDSIRGLLVDLQRRLETARRAAAFARAHDADWSAGAFEALYAELHKARARV